MPHDISSEVLKKCYGKEGSSTNSLFFNSLTTEKQTTKFSSANFQKMLSPSYIIQRIETLKGKQSRS